MLGVGQGGMVGLWEYEGDAERRPAVTQVAVKQWTNREYPKLPFECEVMEILSQAKSKHIVRWYMNAHHFDSDGGYGYPLIAMYLEYCPAGDLSAFLKLDPDPSPILEVDLWGMFYCLASAISVIARETEDVDSDLMLGLNDDYNLVHYE
jgi:hypothetical protein